MNSNAKFNREDRIKLTEWRRTEEFRGQAMIKGMGPREKQLGKKKPVDYSITWAQRVPRCRKEAQKECGTGTELGISGKRQTNKKERAQIRFLGSWSSKHANLAANSGSIRPLLTPAAATADIEVLISFLSLESLYRHYGFHASPSSSSFPIPFLFLFLCLASSSSFTFYPSNLPPLSLFPSLRKSTADQPSAVDICISIGWLKIYNYAAPVAKNGEKNFSTAPPAPLFFFFQSYLDEPSSAHGIDASSRNQDRACWSFHYQWTGHIIRFERRGNLCI